MDITAREARERLEKKNMEKLLEKPLIKAFQKKLTEKIERGGKPEITMDVVYSQDTADDIKELLAYLSYRDFNINWSRITGVDLTASSCDLPPNFSKVVILWIMF